MARNTAPTLADFTAWWNTATADDKARWWNNQTALQGELNDRLLLEVERLREQVNALDDALAAVEARAAEPTDAVDTPYNDCICSDNGAACDPGCPACGIPAPGPTEVNPAAIASLLGYPVSVLPNIVATSSPFGAGADLTVDGAISAAKVAGPRVIFLRLPSGARADESLARAIERARRLGL